MSLGKPSNHSAAWLLMAQRIASALERMLPCPTHQVECKIILDVTWQPLQPFCGLAIDGTENCFCIRAIDCLTNQSHHLCWRIIKRYMLKSSLNLCPFVALYRG